MCAWVAKKFNLETNELNQKKVSVVIPTYKEAENLTELVTRLREVGQSFGNLEIIIVDDNSGDGTVEKFENLQDENTRLIVRDHERGLSTAVIRGMQEATGEILICMDADLSHPPEKLPEIVQSIVSDQADMVFGSRFVKGASIESGWSLFRWINSAVATSFARPFVRIQDPMSGFFALRRAEFEKAKEKLSPIGYKIGLELIVKTEAKRVVEVPIHFADRKKGQSKLSFKEQLNYLRHIRRLANYKFGHWSYFAQFALVGFSGSIVNLAFITLIDLFFVPLNEAELKTFGVTWNWAIVLSIWVAMTTNFILNWTVTFSYARNESKLRKYFGFVAACSLGAIINYSVSVALMERIETFARWPQLAVVVGILSAMIFNFMANRFWVFKPKSI